MPAGSQAAWSKRREAPSWQFEDNVWTTIKGVSAGLTEVFA